MKKGSIVFLVLLLVPFLSAVTVNMHEEYARGENLIIRLSGNFPSQIYSDSVKFFKDTSEIQIDYDFQKIGLEYYVSASLVGREPGNYSVQFEEIKYSEAGQINEGTFSGNFTISNDIADFSVDKGIIFANSDFEIVFENFKDSLLVVEINLPEGILGEEEISLAPGETKAAYFELERINQSLVADLNLSSDDTDYLIPIYVFDQGTILNECGNDKIEPGEECDGNEWGGVDGCSDLRYDKGSLKCVDCLFDTSMCYDEVCDSNRDCAENQFCKNDECVKKECTSDSNCSRKEDCKMYECVPIECDANSDCPENYYCDDEQCVSKECSKDTDCEDNEECLEWGCVLKENACSSDSQCLESQVCDKGNCISRISFDSCSELNGEFCGENKDCEGESQIIDGERCCLDSCIAKTSSSGKVIGWILIIAVIVILGFLFFKYKNTKK